MRDVFPLFGAYEERKWAKGFEPQFHPPHLPRTISRGWYSPRCRTACHACGSNTAFDAATGHVQYVYWMHDLMVTLIDIHVTRKQALAKRRWR